MPKEWRGYDLFATGIISFSLVFMYEVVVRNICLILSNERLNDIICVIQILAGVFCNKDSDASVIPESVSFILVSLKYHDPLLSLTYYSCFLACLQVCATWIGVNICMSKPKSDDWFLQGIFTGVILGGSEFNKNIDWRTVFPLSIPIMRDIWWNKDNEKPHVIAGTMLMAIIGFFLSKFIPVGINYFIVNAFMGYTGMKLLSTVL